jgi:cardiolipin synthase
MKKRLGLLAVAVLWSSFYLQGHLTPRASLKFGELPGVEAPHFPDAIASLTNSIATSGRVTQAWNKPEDYFQARLDAIKGAEKVIRFETFYMTPGRRADDFAAALIERAKAGVKVQLLVDAAGAALPEDYWTQLEAAGVEVRKYHPFEWRSPLRYNARTHRKMLVVDGRLAITGGAGVSDLWDGNPRRGERAPWVDWEFQLEGPVVSTLEGVFMQHWSALGGSVSLPPQVEAPRPGDTPMLVTAGDPADDESAVRLLYQATLRAAKKRLWIASPYFLPDASARQTLIEARKRGIDVRVLTEGPLNDKPYAYHAMREQYGDLLTAGVLIAEHQPSFMHAKALLIDDRWVCLGSANFDPRSFHQNDELNFSVLDPALAGQVEAFFRDGFANSKNIEREDWQARPGQDRVMGRAAWWFRYQL